MAAPSSTVWGSVAGNEGGRIGIYTSVSNTSNTTSKVTIEVWFWSNYTVSDTSNSYYFNTNATSATTLKGSVSISHTSSTSWSTSNQTKLGSYEYEYQRATSVRTINCAAKLTGISSGRLSGATMTATTSYNIPALPSYTITYNANGGSGAPSSQTKYYGKTLTLSTVLPTRDGYNFLGWSTSSTATTATYSAGSSYTTNTSATLYAVWTASSVIQTIMARYQNTDGAWGAYSIVYSAALEAGNTCSWNQEETDEFEAASISYIVSETTTKYVNVYRKQYTVSFDANGGVWTPPNITYYYDSDLYLTKRPTRSGYEFIGWSSDSSATTAEYTITDLYDTKNTAAPTLYAIWIRRPQNICLYNTGESVAAEYIEGESSVGFGKDGAVYASSVIEETLDNGDFAFDSDFIAATLQEGNINKYYLTDNGDNYLTDNNGNHLIVWDEEE